MAKKWSQEDEKFLKANFEKMSNEELAKKCGVSENSMRTKLSRLGLKRAATPKTKKTKPSRPAKKVRAKSQIKNKPVTRDIVHDNIRCRYCLIVDGYTKKEETCRHCKAKLFKGDVM